MIDIDDPKYIEERNNRKLTADKICQILSKVKNNPSSSAKRWVWELIQNAKDVKNSYERVSVQIELTNDDLIFRHNGDPFSLQNIFSLIQQVSSKDSANEDTEVTGKFGTGFIATHLLSEIIHVSGVVSHKGVYRRFQIELDRSGEKSEEMLPKIDAALNKAHQIEDDTLYPRINDYLNQRSESDLDTVFRYPLETGERKKAARAGIDDLVNTLPLTLVNIPKIKTVEIVVNLESESKEVYRSEIIEAAEEYSKITVKDDAGPSRNFVVYKGNDLLLTSEVSDFNSMEMIESFGEAPNLYRDFPLIGSEKFYFPFIINGQRFNPTEDRDGILLHGVEAADAEENRSIMESAFETAKAFTEWLVKNNSKNRYICAYSRFPDEKWEDFSREWFGKLQEDYRSFLLEQEIVETDLGVRKLEECLIPTYGSSDEKKLSFYRLVKPLLGSDKVPMERIALDWVKVTGPSLEIESWGRQIRYDLDALLQAISELETLDGLSEKLGGQESALTWLNEVYAFLIEIKETEEFDKFKILPNQNGHFRLRNDLSLESKESPIPDEFLDVLLDFELDWREDLIHRKVQLPGQNIQLLELSDLSKEINSFLSETRSVSYGEAPNKFLERDDRVEILVKILSLVPASSSRDDFRCRIFKFGKDLLQYDAEFKVVNNTEGFSFDRSVRLLIGIINEQIEKSENVDGLSSKLTNQAGNALVWLNAYLCCLGDKSDFQNELENGNIIPNRLGTFCAREDIYSFGTEETPLDSKLIEILYALDNEHHWNMFLVAEGISLSFPSKTFSELGDTVDQVLKDIENEEVSNPGTLDTNKGAILDLLNWCHKNEDLATRYLKHVVNRQDPLWVRFTLNPELFQIIRDDKNLALLKQMASKGVSAEKVMEIVELASDLEQLGVDGLQQMIAHGKDVLEERQNFEFLKAIGESVETAFKEALEAEGLDVRIGHVSKGAFDLVVSPRGNPSKQLFIEMKSYRYGSRWDFKFANSQIMKAVTEKQNYVVCTLERPANDGLADVDYIRSHVKGYEHLHEIVGPVIGQIETYQSLKRMSGGVRLVLDELGAPRVHVPYNTIRSQSHDFRTVVDSIKDRLLQPEG